MRKFVVHYSDKTFCARGERYNTKPYDTQREAENMRNALESLGASDFEIVPFNERKAA